MRVFQFLPKFLLQHLGQYTYISVGSLWILGVLRVIRVFVRMSACHYGTVCLWGLWTQQSLDSGIDVSSSSNEGLQVGLTVDEAHGVQLVELGLEPHLWGLGLKENSPWRFKYNQQHFLYHNTIFFLWLCTVALPPPPPPANIWSICCISCCWAGFVAALLGGEAGFSAGTAPAVGTPGIPPVIKLGQKKKNN